MIEEKTIKEECTNKNYSIDHYSYICSQRHFEHLPSSSSSKSNCDFKTILLMAPMSPLNEHFLVELVVLVVSVVLVVELMELMEVMEVRRRNRKVKVNFCTIFLF